MKLDYLLNGLEYILLQGNIEKEISDISYNSDEIKPDNIFVCIKGMKEDGHNYISEAIEKGAAALIVQKDIKASENITVIKVEDTRKALAYISAAFFGYPAEKLKKIAITGTKGKTTTSYMIKNVLEKSGIKTGLIGTIETIIGVNKVNNNNTTPQSYIIHKYFREMADEGCQAVVMEVSSQALMMKRTEGIIFDYAVFTNIQQDHIGENEHKDFADYMRCKALLFKQCKKAIVNIDDEHTKDILKDTKCEVETFGFSDKADFKAENTELFAENGLLGVKYDLIQKERFKVKCPISGKFNVYNSLAAICIADNFNIDFNKIQDGLEATKVKGRMEFVKVSEDFTVIIDYAHNAMSLKSLLENLREYKPNRLICMFGCGGNRSRFRRFEMGEISSRLADLTVVTSDNPRYEKPEDIIQDIIEGIKKADGKYMVISDRKEAIKYCLLNAEKGDIIVFAGKGHEDYQEIKGRKYPMDERVIISEILNNL